jgi:hypothetical protein
MACPTKLRSFDLFLLCAPSRIRVKDSLPDGVAEVSRKGAKALRFEQEIAGLVVNPTNLRCLDWFLFFAPSRLGVSDCISCIESDRPSVTAQPDRCREEPRSKEQPEPETRRAQISSRSELCE